MGGNTSLLPNLTPMMGSGMTAITPPPSPALQPQAGRSNDPLSMMGAGDPLGRIFPPQAQTKTQGKRMFDEGFRGWPVRYR